MKQERSAQKAQPGVAPEKQPWEEPKLAFIEPTLTKHGQLEEVTAGFFGGFSPLVAALPHGTGWAVGSGEPRSAMLSAATMGQCAPFSTRGDHKSRFFSPFRRERDNQIDQISGRVVLASGILALSP
jgi:hypothetical protein